MKPYSTLALVIIISAVLFPPAANAQYPPCVDYSLAHREGVSAPMGIITPYNPTLTLPAGSYRYTYGTTGSVPIQNFSLVSTPSLTYWSPFSYTIYLPSASTTGISFKFYIPTAQPLCSAANVHIQFKRQTALAWNTTCTFDLNVVVRENGEPKNLTVVEGQSKVYYAGGDYKAYSMTWNSPIAGAWNYAALNVVGGWGAVQIEGRMASFADGSRIFFKGKDKKLYNLIQQSGNNWTLSLVMASLPDVTGGVAARNSNEVVFYGIGGLHQLLLTGNTWTDQIIPCSACGPSNNSSVISLPPASNNIFFSIGSDLVQVYQNSSGGSWIFEKINPANVPWGYIYDTTQLSSDMVAAENYAVYYRGRDKRIHRYTKCGATWKLDAMPISPASETNVVVLSAFLTKFPGEDRVFYKAATGRIYNIYNVNGVWFNYPLDNAMVNAAGDLIAAENKIFYINHDKRVHGFFWGGSAWSDVPLSTTTPANVKGCINPYY